MSAFAKSILLFLLNWLDGQLTIIWVHAHLATEGNGLMARLLEAGPIPFLSVKLGIGAFAAYVLYRCSHLPVARKGMSLVLGIYFVLMLVHTATGISALGCHSHEVVLAYLGSLPNAVLALFG